MTSPATPIVGPFVVHSRKGNFGNQDLESAQRLALAQRQEPDVEFVESATGRRFSCAELITALDRQGHQPIDIAPPQPPAAGPGLQSFRSFATSTVDLDIDGPGAPLAPPAKPATPIPAARHSDRQRKQRSDRRPVVGDDNQMLIGVLILGVAALGAVAYVLNR